MTVCPYIDQCEHEVTKEEFEEFCKYNFHECDHYYEYKLHPPKKIPKDWLDR